MRRLPLLVALAAFASACFSSRPATRADKPAEDPSAESPDRRLADTLAPQRNPPPLARRIPPRVLARDDPDRTMRIHLLDVGQGSAMLLEFPCAVMMVDTGGELNDAFDGTAVLKAQLDAFFDRRKDLARTIDLLVLTHPHIDHLRGVPVLQEHFKVRRVVDNGQPGDDLVAGAMDAVNLMVAAGTERRSVTREDVPEGGLKDPSIDNIACSTVDPVITVLWGSLASDPGWKAGEYGSPFKNANNHSVVTRVDFGEASILITGDLETVGIHDLVAMHAETRILDTDIYVVGHHGSHNGTTEELMLAIRPQVALMSMGPESRHRSWTAYAYGHPRAAAVDVVTEHLVFGRKPVEVNVGRGVKRFNRQVIDRALYATGWEGPVTVTADADGNLAVDAPSWNAPPPGAADAPPGPVSVMEPR